MGQGFRIGFGYDVHQLEDGRRFVLGGIEIPFEKGPVAHSDGDVLIHAICDALLGAAGLEDIGKHFPDTSSEFRGIDSKVLLGRVYSLLEEKGYKLINVDSTVSLQRPKIREHISKMQSVLSGILNVSPDRVSIKATTTERLGFVGREEGIAAQAVALISEQ